MYATCVSLMIIRRLIIIKANYFKKALLVNCLAIGCLVSSGIARVGQAGAEEMSTEIKSTYVNSKSNSEVLGKENSSGDYETLNIIGNTSNLLLQSKTVNDSIKELSEAQVTENIVNGEEIVNQVNPEEEQEDVYEEVEEEVEADITEVDESTAYIPSDALLAGNAYDENYKHPVVSLSANDRYILEHLVMGEAGGQGFEGCALVAQCIRDAMVYRGYDTVEDVRKGLKYSGSLKREPNQDVLDAVSYIFDNGGIAVHHKIIYFYSPSMVSSKFHESQQLIVEYGGHRYFSTWN